MNSDLKMKDMIARMILKDNYWGYLFSRIRRISDQNLDSVMGVAVDKEGNISLNYHPDLVEKTDQQYLEKIVEHEGMHLLNKHLQRFYKIVIVERNPSIKLMKMDTWNMAADCAANEQANIKEPVIVAGRSIPPLLPSMFDLKSSNITEHYYYELLKKNRSSSKKTSIPNFLKKKNKDNKDENNKDDEKKTISCDTIIYVTDSNNNRIQLFQNDSKFIQSFGSKDDGQYNKPTDISIGNKKAVIVDSGNNKIISVKDDSIIINIGNNKGNNDGQFDSPFSAVIDSRIYVTDTNNNRIQKFELDGTFSNKWGSKGTDTGKFDKPKGICIDKIRNIYVVDSGNNRIQIFKANGSYVREWGSKGSDNGQFDNPTGISIDDEDYVYITDTGNNQIQIFKTDGTFVRKWGSRGSLAGQFDNPTGICVDKKGYVYVVDSGNNRIQVFMTTGTFIREWGSKGSDNSQFDNPTGISSFTINNGNGDGGSSSGFDDHSGWAKNQIEGDPNVISRKIEEYLREIVSDSIKNFSNKRGTLPSNIASLIDQFMKPTEIPYYQMIRKLVIGSRLSKFSKCYTRINRKRGYLLATEEDLVPIISPFPGRKSDYSFKINLLIDTSGSMSCKDIQEALKSIKDIIENDRYCIVHVVENDACIQKEYDVKRIRDIQFEVKGRGGTTLMPGIDRCRELNADVTLGFTDGYCEDLNSVHRRRFPKKMIWVITENGDDKSLNRTGYVVHLKKES